MDPRACRTFQKAGRLRQTLNSKLFAPTLSLRGRNYANVFKWREF